MARYAGFKGAVYGSKTGTGAASPVASLSKWSLQMTTGKQDVTAFNDLNLIYVQTLRDIKGSVSGFWDSADDSLFDMSESTDGVKLYLYPSTLVPTQYWYGPAWLDASIDVDAKGTVNVSGDFVAAGAWGRL
jgi:hypothetical protein